MRFTALHYSIGVKNSICYKALLPRCLGVEYLSNLVRLQCISQITAMKLLVEIHSVCEARIQVRYFANRYCCFCTTWY